MFKISKLKFIIVFLIGSLAQVSYTEIETETEAEVAKRRISSMRSEVPGFTHQEVKFVKDAYCEYQLAIKTVPAQNQKALVMKYCNKLLSRFNRARLLEMYEASLNNSQALQKALKTALQCIDQLGETALHWLDNMMSPH